MASSSADKFTPLEVPAELVDAARALELDASAIAEAALASAVRHAQAKAWLTENAEALAQRRAWIKRNGPPLAKWQAWKPE